MRHHLLNGYHQIHGAGILLLRGSQGRMVSQLVNQNVIKPSINHVINPTTALVNKVIGNGIKGNNTRQYKPLQFKTVNKILLIFFHFKTTLSLYSNSDKDIIIFILLLIMLILLQ